jgi:hypothetical protein
MLMYALGTAVSALAVHRLVTLIALCLAGGAWMIVANTLMVTATMALPDWVRARGLSMIQMAMMGSSAAGAALWGYLAGPDRRSGNARRVGAGVSARALA